MAVGIIGYLSKRGLGQMTHDLRKHLGIDRQLVVPDEGWLNTPEWCNAEEFYLQQWEIQRDDLRAWQATDQIDTIVTIETPFGENTFKWAKELGMRTILLPMWESYHPRLPAYRNVDLSLCVSWKCYQEVPYDQKRFIPWPVDTEEFKFRERTGPARAFVHNTGSGGINGRKGTEEAIHGFFRAIETTPDIQMILGCQVPLKTIIPEFLANRIESDSHFIIKGPAENRADQYAEGEVLVYCSKYDGHALVTLEAMACGLPVITTDSAPMNEYFLKNPELLVQVEKREPAGMINPHCDRNIVSIDDLAAKIVWCAQNDMSEISKRNRETVEKEHSWEVLRDQWKKAIFPK